MERLATHRRRNRRGLIAGGVAIAVVFALGAWGWRDLASTEATEKRARAELRSTRTDVRDVAADLRETLNGLAVAEQALTASTAERDQLVEEGQLVAGQLAAARDALVGAALHLDERASAAVEIRACLDGISTSLNALAVGDSAAALARVRAVAGVCETAA